MTMPLRDALRAAPPLDDLSGLRLLEAGRGWDVVRVPAQEGFLALARLRDVGEPLGPVLYDRPGDRLYFAVYTGSADSWERLPVRFLSRGGWFVVPRPDHHDEWFGGWCELPGDGTLTDPDVLRRALRAGS
ncbi:hypothetical protein [Streptomyces venezuelae]